MNSLDVGVLGGGAIGGSLAARLASSGERVTLVARGANGRAIREQGLVLHEGGRELRVPLPCCEQAGDLGPQDVIVVAVKGRDLSPLASVLPGLLKPGGRLVLAMNGIPFWFDRFGGFAWPAAVREMLDPGGELARQLPLHALVGAVVLSSAEVLAPGIVRSPAGDRRSVILGRPDGGVDAVTQRFADALSKASYATRISSDIRAELWAKLMLFCSAGPLSALTGADLGVLAAEPSSEALWLGMMNECLDLGSAVGLAVDAEPRAVLDAFRGTAVRPSMLQDVEAGRSPEIESGLLAVDLIARGRDMELPRLSAVAALMRMKWPLAVSAGDTREEN
ncbi:2-dehydropantoate 2-reductase [Paucibacter sp. R3-3]|uniref:2-dehydropantoate 2-reductase n=1 Tax=Roseateles agri TaxID=3098619 RepID=A0ABU5DP44_9BURK|nr:2-dehydropantoate 2-reductase [Paucibacter sp. R3-3]MDY0748063.1 2-dehydropantoate 2-reductase [Paucibacter sp. R3-3]